MNQTLVDNNYLVVPGFISPKQVTQLKEWLFKERDAGRLIQDPRSNIGLFGKACYDGIPFLELLCEKRNEVSNLVEEPVLPTYSYSIIYGPNSQLTRHTDRDACEISLTVHIGGDASWNIGIQKPNGEEVSIELNPGDAMLYLGCTADHWREPYTGNDYAQVFMHYVRSEGPNAWAYFDKRK